jgi:hypothetical protein
MRPFELPYIGELPIKRPPPSKEAFITVMLRSGSAQLARGQRRR